MQQCGKDTLTSLVTAELPGLHQRLHTYPLVKPRDPCVVFWQRLSLAIILTWNQPQRELRYTALF